MELDIATAHALLTRLDPTLVLVGIKRLAGWDNGGVYEVRCTNAGRDVVVKVYPESAPWQMAQEVFLYDTLARHTAVPVPRVLLSDDSRKLIQANLIVMTKLEGRAVGSFRCLSRNDYASIYRQMGEMLRAIHAIAFDSFGYIASAGFVEPYASSGDFMCSMFDRALTRFAELGGDVRLRKAATSCMAAGKPLFDLCPTAVLCHNDFHEGNVLARRASGQWKLTGVVDVSGAIAADPLLDIARTDYWSIRGDAAKREALLDGYGLVREEWRETVQLYSLYHALEFWNWFAARGGQQDVVHRIGEDIERLSTTRA